MISQAEFDKIELEHGCGYYNICVERSCPCAITKENKGLQEKIWISLRSEINDFDGDVLNSIELECDPEYDLSEDEFYGEDVNPEDE